MKRTFVSFFLILLLSVRICSAEVVINEVLPNLPPDFSETAYEWVELFNTGEENIDLKGYVLEDEKKNRLIIDDSFTESGTLIERNEYLVIYRSGSSFSLNNDADTIFLYESTDSANPLDVIGYESAKENQAFGRDPLRNNTFLALLSPSPGEVNISVPLPSPTPSPTSTPKSSIDPTPVPTSMVRPTLQPTPTILVKPSQVPQTVDTQDSTGNIDTQDEPVEESPVYKNKTRDTLNDATAGGIVLPKIMGTSDFIYEGFENASHSSEASSSAKPNKTSYVFSVSLMISLLCFVGAFYRYYQRYLHSVF